MPITLRNNSPRPALTYRPYKLLDEILLARMPSSDCEWDPEVDRWMNEGGALHTCKSPTTCPSAFR